MILNRSFYEREDVTLIARELLGKRLISRKKGKLTVGRIVETEAYSGRTDRASHAYKRRTQRTEVMYGKGGVAYVYLCYGIHRLFNIVTNVEGLADAVLIRAVQPLTGADTMLQRRKKTKSDYSLTSGPGKLSVALGIDLHDNGQDLTGGDVWLEEGEDDNQMTDIVETTRIGIDYAGPDKLLPWRYYIRGNKWVSKF